MSLLSFLSTDPNNRMRGAQLQSEGSGLKMSKNAKQQITVEKLTRQAVLSDFPLPAQLLVILKKPTTVSLQGDNMISELTLLPQQLAIVTKAMMIALMLTVTLKFLLHTVGDEKPHFKR